MNRRTHRKMIAPPEVSAKLNAPTSLNTVKLIDAGSDRGFTQSVLWGILLVVIACAVAWAHWPALSAEAISFDDPQYLTENLLVQTPSWSSTKQFITEIWAPSTVQGYYQPLTMISLMLDHAMGGRSDYLYPFHRTSLILHVINTLLIIVLLHILFGEPWIAAMVGLLFGVHPLTVEPIPWIGERKTLLASFFALWCLILYVRYTRKPGKALYSASVLMFVLAVMSKPTSTPLPVCMLLLDYWPLRRLNRRAFIEKIPFFLLVAVSSVITFFSQETTAGVYYAGNKSALDIPFILAHNIVFYLYKMVWPANLSSHYPFPVPMALSHPMILIGVIGTCIFILLLFISLRWTKALLVGWLFFFVAIFPTLGIIGFTNVIASDKYAYLPSLGILIFVAWFLKWCWTSDFNILNKSRAIRQATLCVIVLTIAVVEVRATRRYLKVWQDTEKLYQHMLSLAPRADILHNNLGLYLVERGRIDEGALHIGHALQLNPDNPEAHVNMGFALAAQRQLDGAVAHYRQAIRLNPAYAKAHNNLGNALADRGEIEEAMTHYRQALKIRPNYVSAHNNIGTALTLQGRTDEAIVHFREALRLKDLVETHNNLGLAFAAQGKVDEAIAHFRHALQRKPDYSIAHYNLGDAFARQGQTDRAIAEYREGLRSDPHNERARQRIQEIATQAPNVKQ